jgi:hypothetical protein
MKSALTTLKNGIAADMANIGTAFAKAYEAEIAATTTRSRRKAMATSSAGMQTPGIAQMDVTGTTLSRGTAGSGTGGSAAVRNITINVQSLIDRFEVKTASVAESAEKIKETVAEALLSALNDANLAV